MKNLTKKILAWAANACIASTAVFIAAGAAMTAYGADGAGALDPQRIWGTVLDKGDSRIYINQGGPSAQGQEMVLTLSPKSTRILNGVSGNPVTIDSIKKGDALYAYIDPAVTLSLPPIANASLILTSIPADYQVPEFLTVKSMELNAGKTEGTLLATNGAKYAITKNSQIFPYLTRNIVTIQDLVPGTACLLWPEAGTSQAAKVMVFPSQALNAGQGIQTGWALKDGTWLFYNQDGSIHTGWLLDQGSWYYLDPATGAMKTGFLTLDGKTYYLQDDGKMLTFPKTFTPDKDGALHP